MNLRKDIKQLKIAAAQNTRERDFWLNQLGGELAKNNFPYDYMGSPGTTSKVNINSVNFTIPEEVIAQLMRISNGDLFTINLVIITGIFLLLHKYTGNNDIIMGMPIYKQDLQGAFINTVLPLRNRIEKKMTFKEFLLQARQTLNDAVENQNYPVEILAEQLTGLPYNNLDSFPLFDIGVLLENIHEKKYMENIGCNMVFSFNSEHEHINGIIEYNSYLYRESTIKNIASHLINLLHTALSNINSQLPAIEMLCEDEKKQLLENFNQTEAPYPAEQTIHHWFEQQVEKTPDHTAVSAPVDLNDIYSLLESDTVKTKLEQKVESLCFKKSPYIYQSLLPLAHENTHLYILKTRGHNCLVVNLHLMQILGMFDGRNNLHILYTMLKGLKREKKMPVEFLIYPIPPEDLLEISFEFHHRPEILSLEHLTNRIEDFFQMVKSLYNYHLIELVGVGSEDSIAEISTDNYFSDSAVPGLSGTNIPETLLIKNNKISTAQALLLGDSPGTATTGLLYLGSYLKRNGIDAFCQFYDPARDYTAMKKNIEELLRIFQPAVVAISLKWFLYIARVIDMSKIVKEHAGKYGQDITVVVGGNTASYYAEDIIKNDCIDVLVRGDGEEPLLRICRGDDIASIPNCLYKNKNGKILQNSFAYVQDKIHSSEIYLSHLDEILLSHYTSRLGTFFIVTHKGCAMNCLYCGGCNKAQQKTFNRKHVFHRGVKEVRKDIMEAKPYASTFMFEFDILNENLSEYCRQIWEGIDLSGHFCLFNTLTPPTTELVELVSRTFKYVYWDFDMCTPSERHRKQLESLGLVKPQPSDAEIIDFFTKCETYENIEVRPNLITGLPFFTADDSKVGEKLLTAIMSTFSCVGELHWARLHAQPGAPVTVDAGKYQMHSYAASFDDFYRYSEKNFNRGSTYATVENFSYPYIYYNDDQLNSRITNFYLETNKKSAQYARDKKRECIVSNALTYQELDKKAAQLTGVLKEAGVKPGDIVGLMLEPSIEIVVGILGIFKAGCAYMPIAPEFPRGRIAYMLNDSSSNVLVTTGKLAEDEKLRSLETKRSHKSIFIDTINTSNTSTSHLFNFSISPSSLAYVIYTSGTTGNPKGVAIKHENLANYVSWFSDKANLTDKDKSILTTSFAFDLGYTALYPPLLNGGELHIAAREIYLEPERLLRYIKQKEVTTMKVTPSLFTVLVNSPGFSNATCQSLRFVAIGGESINVKDIEKAHSLGSHLKIMNHYGPTETTIGCAATIIDFTDFEEYKTHPVIGKPIANTTIYILGKGLELLPIGVPGELCISGAGVGRGYLNNPELTAEKFGQNLWDHRNTYDKKLLPESGGRFSRKEPPGRRRQHIYRTGDLARWQPGGNIEFLGRIDSQVKIRGYRIELGEIEKRLKAHPRVEEAVVLVKEDMIKKNTSENNDKYLCAYIVPKRKKFAINTGAEAEKKILTSKDILDTAGQPEGKTSSILSLFQKQVKANGDKEAVKSEDRILTYYSLDRLTDQVARKIIEEYDDRYKLTKKERIRYKRQMLLHGWSAALQEKLKATSVFVAGAGGGASPTIIQLALIGIGTIRVCDFDEVELSNLNRQFLHNEERLGMNKALSAQIEVSKTNPHVKVIPLTRRLTRENIGELIGDSEIIFDMFDEPADKFILSEYAVDRGIPHVIISMTDINAYTAVLHTPSTPCLHCIFDKKKLDTIVAGMQSHVENYSKNPLPVVATSLFISTGTAVNESLKILLGFKSPAYNKFFYFNQRGEDENLVYTPGYKAMTYLFSDHFLQSCKAQGFDWDIGWRGRYMEELEITADPGCPICGAQREWKKAEIASDLRQINLAGKDAEKPMQTVGILLDMGINMASAHIGLLKARKTPVLLNPSSSLERLCHILEDSEARVILTNGRLQLMAEKLRDTINMNIKVVNIEFIDQANQADVEFKFDLNPEPISCIIYPPDSETPIVKFYNALLHGTGNYTFEKKKNQMEQNSFALELTNYLQEVLPVYMIPSHFVKLDQIPLTPNGKVDIKSLPEHGTEEKKDLDAPPRNKTEEKLVEIWAEVLGVDKNKIGINSNFFQLGGHSLNATIIISKIHRELNVKVPMREIFETPTIMGIGAFIINSKRETFEFIKPKEEKEYYPASAAQKRMFILKQLKGEHTTSDSIPMIWLVKGNLDTKYFEEIILKLMERHDALRTSFGIIKDQVVQKVIPSNEIRDKSDFKLTYLASKEDDLQYLLKEFIRPFDFGKAPLFRLTLVKVDQEKYLILQDIHHIITDGTSNLVFMRDFIYLFKGLELPKLKIQYKDFTYWQEQYLIHGVIREQEKYWLNIYSDKQNIPVLNIPTDFPRPPVQVFEGSSIHFQLDEEVVSKVKKLVSENEGTTLFMVFLSILDILLFKYSGQTDIIVGVPIRGRKHSDLENVMGFFINTLPIRNYPDKEKTYAKFLNEVKYNALNAYENQDFQFEDLVRMLNIEPDPSNQPLFSVMLQHGKLDLEMEALEKVMNPSPNATNLYTEQISFQPYNFENTIIQFDLLFHLIDFTGGIHFKLLYSTKLFKKETIENLVDHFKNITNEVTANPDIKISEIEMFAHGVEESMLKSDQEKLEQLEVHLDF